MASRTRLTKVPSREAPSPHKFKVHLSDFACEGLSPDEPNGCKAYLKIDFDSFKVYKTAPEPDPENLNPEWGFKAGFQYTINYLEQLGRRELKVQCFNSVNNSLIGVATVDLQTLACGPTHYQLSLRGPPPKREETQDETKAAAGAEQKEKRGTLKFNCVMKMMSSNLTIICQDLTLTMQGCYAPAKLIISPTLDEKENQAQAIHVPHSQEGIWPGPFSFTFETTLKDLLKANATDSGLRFAVHDDSNVRQGEALLSFRKHFTPKPDNPVCFKVPVTYSCSLDGEEERENMGTVGYLEGVVVYQNLPAYAQLVNGTYADGQVEGAHLFIEGLPYPQCMSEPPPIWQDPTERTGLDFFTDMHQNEDSELGRPEEWDDRQLSEALAQIDLPPPWEKRRERAGGRMYFADPRSRRMTWKDPRFLPENWDQRIDPQTGKVYFQYHRTRQTTYVDPRGCPHGWDMRISKNGDIYFAHLPSMQTTFTDPRGLPENIEAALDDHGRMYFKNHENKSTQWEDPRQNQQEVVLAKWRHGQLTAWWKEAVFREIEQRAEAENRSEEDSPGA